MGETKTQGGWTTDETHSVNRLRNEAGVLRGENKRLRAELATLRERAEKAEIISQGRADTIATMRTELRKREQEVASLRAKLAEYEAGEEEERHG